jgi:hypothetical protein
MRRKACRGRFFLGALMHYLLWGKILETVGALLLAYVGVWIAVHEVLVGRFLRDGLDAPSGDTEKFRERLREIFEFRRRQFGFREALCVAFGTVLIFVGCALYLYGLWTNPH